MLQFVWRNCIKWQNDKIVRACKFHIRPCIDGRVALARVVLVEPNASDSTYSVLPQTEQVRELTPFSCV